MTKDEALHSSESVQPTKEESLVGTEGARALVKQLIRQGYQAGGGVGDLDFDPVAEIEEEDRNR